MDISTLVLLVIVAVLVVAFTLTAWGLSRRNRRMQASLDETRRQQELTANEVSTRHAANLREIEARHGADLSALGQQHERLWLQRDADHAAAMNELAAERDEASLGRDRARFLAASGLKWELSSRELLVKACSEAGLDAIVATNIVFAPGDSESGKPYCAQLDHLVITEKAIVLIDSKNWAGVIFDGMRPSSLAGALSVLTDEQSLPDSYAICWSRDGGEALRVRSRLGQDSPVTKIRRQARRFNHHLKAQLTSAPFVQTCVFYSHPESRVLSKAAAPADGTWPTRIASVRSIRQVLVDAQSGGPTGPTSQQLTGLVEILRGLGADLYGVGRFAADLVSPVPLDYRMPPSKKLFRPDGSGTSPQARSATS